jgi:hypothetical protein
VYKYMSVCGYLHYSPADCRRVDILYKINIYRCDVCYNILIDIA